MKKIEKTPKKAMNFIDTGECFANHTDDGFEMLGYSGGVIKNHWWWGNLIINLSGMKFPKRVVPILQQHDIERKIGFAPRPDISSNNLQFNSITYLNNNHAESFKNDSKSGFPFEASISVKDVKVLRLEEGAKMTVNGRKVKGPMTVFDESTFKECSVCVFGADPNTKSKALSELDCVEFSIDVIEAPPSEGKQSSPTKQGGKTVMNLAELKEKHPELVAQLQDEAKATAEAEVNKLSTVNSELSTKMDNLLTKFEEQGKTILSFQKNDAIRTAKDLERQGSDLWDSKLSASDLPENMFSKVKAMVSHSNFVKDDVLDVEAFGTAIDTEIADWTTKLTSNSSVQGFGSSHKSDTGEPDESDEHVALSEDEAWAKDMLGRTGQLVQ